VILETLRALGWLVARLAKYLRDYGLKGAVLFSIKAFAILLSRPPSRPSLVRTRTGLLLMLLPGDRGICAELSRWRVHEPFLTTELAKVVSKGMVVLDVGSNVGYYTVHEAALVGPEGVVVAVEPQPHAYKALLASLKANGFGNVVAVRRAVSKVRGSLKFAISSFSNWSRVNASRTDGDVVEVMDVEASSIDDLVSELGLQRLDLVRMDVEGYEEEVIEGMREVIDGFRPVICMELHAGYLGLERSIALLAGLMRKGYRMLFAAPRLLDYYPLSSSPYAVYPKGDARQQLLEVFEKPYMHEVIHVCLSPNEWRKATSSSINREMGEL
jgi:FkbM family methyltransferase